MRNDHDITVRMTAAGMVPGKKRLDRAMGNDVRWCFEENLLDEVMRRMSAIQIRRVAVVIHDVCAELVDILSLGDLVTKTAEGE